MDQQEESIPSRYYRPLSNGGEHYKFGNYFVNSIPKDMYPTGDGWSIRWEIGKLSDRNRIAFVQDVEHAVLITQLLGKADKGILLIDRIKKLIAELSADERSHADPAADQMIEARHKIALKLQFLIDQGN